MIARNCTEADLKKALDMVNIKYSGNVIFKRLDFPTFTLRVQDSSGPGARLHYQPWAGRERRGISACWHVHGDFFDCLFNINPGSYVLSSGRKITKDEGNWIDWNIGSIMYPFNYSQSCHCTDFFGSARYAQGFRSREVQQSKLSAECWPVQIWGPLYCETCEFKGTDECGGQQIRKSGINESGYPVPVK